MTFAIAGMARAISWSTNALSAAPTATGFAALLRTADNDQSNPSSAQSALPDGSTDDELAYSKIKSGMEDWIVQRGKAGADAGYMDRLTGAKDAYLAVVEKAQAAGGFADPLQFVRSLSTRELAALQNTHGLADPINPATLTEEGAYNLLVPVNQARDIDKNGLTSIGIGNHMVFPPETAPQAFKDSWAKTGETLDPGVRMTMELQMWNAGQGGMPVTGASPSGTSAFYAADFSYSGLVDKMIETARDNLRYQQGDTQKAYGRAILSGYEALRDNLSTARDS